MHGQQAQGGIVEREHVERLGKWMSRARERWGWSRDTVHSRAGITDRSQRAIEQGERATVQAKTLAGIARGFGLTERDLHRIMSGEDVPISDLPPSHSNGRTSDDAALWDEVTDLRRRLVESETRTQIRLDEMQQKLERLLGR